MIEPTMKKEELRQVKVSLSLKQEIEDEATRMTRTARRKVTEGEVVHRAWQAYVKAGTVGDSGQAIGPANQGADISGSLTNKSDLTPINRGTTNVRSNELLNAIEALERTHHPAIAVLARALREIAISIGGESSAGKPGADSRDPLIPPEEFARDREAISARVGEIERAHQQSGEQLATGTGRNKRGGAK